METLMTDIVQSPKPVRVLRNFPSHTLPHKMAHIQAIDLHGDVYIIGSQYNPNMFKFDQRTQQWRPFTKWMRNWFRPDGFFGHCVVKYRDGSVEHKDDMNDMNRNKRTKRRQRRVWSLLALNARTNEMKYLTDIERGRPRRGGRDKTEEQRQVAWVDVEMPTEVQMTWRSTGARMTLFGTRDREHDQHVLITEQRNVYVYDLVQHCFKAVFTETLPSIDGYRDWIYHVLFQKREVMSLRSAKSFSYT